MSAVPVVPEIPVAEVVAPVEIVVEPVVESVEQVVEPVVVPVPPVPVQKRYEYQPQDEHGRALGGRQVILYTTQEELVEKLTAQSVEQIRKMRQLSRDNRLGRTQKDEIAPEIERIQPLVNFVEKPLSPEDRFTISQQLADPEQFESARDKLFESAIGVKPADLRDTLNRTQLQTEQLVARQNCQEWMYEHPEVYQCQENVNTVVDYMVKNGLKPTVKNFEFAQLQMQEAGLLLSSPIVREAPVPEPVTPTPVALVVEAPKLQEPAQESVRINEIPVSQAEPSATVIPTVEKRQSQIPSSLNNRISSSMGNDATPSVIEKLTYADIERMPSDVYKKNLMNPAFAKHVNELEAKRPARPHPQR